MTEKKRAYAVIGAGAVGALYGARLQQAGHEVHFLMHSDYEHVKEHGLSVESIDGDIRLPEVKAYSRAEEMPQCDVVIVALKTTANGILKDILPGVAGPGAVVLLMQNGLGEEDRIAALLPGRCIIGGLCFLCSNKVGPGHIKHLDFGHVHIAEYRADHGSAGITEQMMAVQSDFAGSGTRMEMLEDLLLARWRKLAWNIPFNGMTVLFDTTTDRLMANESTVAMAEELMHEVAAGAAAYGREIEQEFIDKMISYTKKMTPYKPSMYIDYEMGRPLEIEAIYGNPVRAAAEKGYDMVGTRMLYRSLQFIDAKT